jgi:hypothetical protein
MHLFRARPKIHEDCLLSCRCSHLLRLVVDGILGVCSTNINCKLSPCFTLDIMYLDN